MTKTPPLPSFPHFRSDQPITNLALDEYSRTAFSEGIAKSILSLPRDECFVIGMHGPWGDGKTSTLRFVEQTLKSHPSTVVTWFNPWRFLNEEAMLSQFFSVLAASVRLDLKTKGEKVAATFAKYGKLVAPFDDRAASITDAAARKAEPSLEQLRERLIRELKSLGKQIVVFIDDIDRLDSSEVASLFRLLKACADFPNVVYVLAFDREMVARTVGARLVDGDAEAGRKFLDKIIQIPIALPNASRQDLERACMRGVSEVLQSVSLVLNESETLRWQLTYQNGIARRMRTPRHVNQFVNAVRFALPLLANEVNTVDLLLVEALRVCYPSAYEVVRASQDSFIGTPVGEIERRYAGSPQDDLLAGSKQGLDRADADALERLVEAMFPRYHVMRKGFEIGYESVRQWTREQLVCSPAYGPRYFSYAIGSSDVADADIESIMHAAANDKSTQLRTLLNKQLEPLKQVMLVVKLKERLTTIPGQVASRIAVMIGTLSDRFEEPFSLHTPNHPGIQAASLSAALCNRLGTEDERLLTANKILRHSATMWFASAFMRQVDPAHPDPIKSPPLVTGEHMSEMRKAFLSHYKLHVRSGQPQLDLERRWKFETLFCVARAGGRELVHDQFVPNMKSDGNVAIRMLQLLAQPVSRSGEIIPSSGDLIPADLEDLHLLVDLNSMAENVFKNWIGESQRKGPEHWRDMNPNDRVLAQFWYHYEQRLRAPSQDGATIKPG